MTHLSQLVQFLDSNLDSNGFDDSSLNGLQVESNCQEVNKVGLAVDSGLSVLEQAIAAKCQLLIVHHGLFWGPAERINGLFGKKIKTLINGNCSLYASHLPLDGHISLGNNAQIIDLLGAKISKPFCLCGQKHIGYLGEFDSPIDVEDLELKLKKITTEDRFLGLKFGKNKIKSIAVVTGAGAFAIGEADSLGADAFITGEPKQSIFHTAKELAINAFFAGHYATEVFGVKATGNLLKEKFGVEIEFLDQPTRI